MVYDWSHTKNFELLMRIELTTSSLPRKCSTPELQQPDDPSWAIAGRTIERKTRLELATYSLEGYRSTKWATPADWFANKQICKCANLSSAISQRTFIISKSAYLHICKLTCGQERIRTSEVERQRIYSPPHLAALEPARVQLTGVFK